MVGDSAPAKRNVTILHPLQHKMLELDVQVDEACMYRTSLSRPVRVRPLCDLPLRATVVELLQTPWRGVCPARAP
jgi:hypothetical protein